MSRVYHRKLVSHSTFRKLPFGAVYWLGSNTATAPLVKVGRAAKAGAFSTDKITQTAVADTSVDVVRVPDVFLKPA